MMEAMITQIEEQQNIMAEMLQEIQEKDEKLTVSGLSFLPEASTVLLYPVRFVAALTILSLIAAMKTR